MNLQRFSRRSRVAFHCLAVCTVIATSFLSASCLLHAQQMVFPGASWQTATPESVLVDSQRLQVAVNELDRTANSINEMLIVRNGRVIWSGNNVDYAHHVFSVTKSFTSTALGLLIDDGKVTLDTLVKDVVPALSELYPEATFEHFVTHTSGYLAADETVPLGADLDIPKQLFTPGTPLFETPGSQFAYTGAAMDMLSNALTRIAGKPLQELFTERIGNSIGINPDGFDWREFEADDGVVVDGGSGYPDKGVSISASNAARFGHLFLNQGNWDGQQLISREWVDLATQVQVPTSVTLHPDSATDGPGLYGYGWWIDQKWFDAAGYQYNYISASPSTGFVIARLGTETSWVDWGSLENTLIAATIPAIWDERGDGRWDEFSSDTGKPRWTTDSGLIPDIYPTGKAIVRSNTVTVASDVPVERLDIESGSVRVATDGTLRSGSRITVDHGAALTVDGTVDATAMSIYGTLDISSGGELAATGLTLFAQSQLVMRGSGRLDRLTLRDARAHISAEGQLHLDRLVQSAGLLLVDGDLTVGNLQVTGGAVELHDKQSPYDITERFRLSGQSELRLVVSDESWDSPITLAEGIVPELSGDLMLDFGATVNPKLLEGQSLNLFDWNDAVQPSGTFARVLSPARVTLDLSRLYTTGEVVLQSVLERPDQGGDFDGNTILDAADIDALSERIRVNSIDTYFDVNADNMVTHLDHEAWLHDLRHTWFGDADLNGEFDSADFVQVFQAGKYDTTEGASWTEGDWNADSVFDSADIITAFEDGGYERGPRTNAAAVPEPTSPVLFLWAMAGLAAARHCVPPPHRRPRVAAG